MPYIVEKLEDQLMDAIAKPEGWIARNPDYADFFADIASMRNGHVEQGTTLKTPDFKLVARMQTPLEDAMRIINPDFLRDKKGFYRFLDRNPQFCTYDRRRGRRQ